MNEENKSEFEKTREKLAKKENQKKIVEVIENATQLGVLKNILVTKRDMVMLSENLTASLLLEEAGKEMTADRSKAVMALVALNDLIHSLPEDFTGYPTIHTSDSEL